MEKTKRKRTARGEGEKGEQQNEGGGEGRGELKRGRRRYGDNSFCTWNLPIYGSENRHAIKYYFPSGGFRVKVTAQFYLGTWAKLSLCFLRHSCIGTECPRGERAASRIGGNCQ